MATEFREIAEQLDKRSYRAGADIIRGVIDSLLRNGLIPADLSQQVSIGDLSPSILGNSIKRLRKEQKKRQVDVAEAAGIHVFSLRRIEAGKANPTSKTVQNVAKALEVPVSSLLQSKPHNPQQS